MLLFAASWQEGMDIIFLGGHHHGKGMTVIILFNGFKGDLNWFPDFQIMELTKDVTSDFRMEQNWRWCIWILWNNQQMQLYAVNFIPLLGSL